MRHITRLASYILTDKKDKSGDRLCKVREACSITLRIDQDGPISSMEGKKKVKERKKRSGRRTRRQCVGKEEKKNRLNGSG
jgi:hypothetical protein